MDSLPSQTITPAFRAAWNAAGLHLQRCAGDGVLVWTRVHFEPPFLDHLSFRVRNALFFVRIESDDGAFVPPGNVQGLRTIAAGCRGRACSLPMRRAGDGWAPVHPGWGLVDVDTGAPVDPVRESGDEPVEMTDWELHDFAVETVRARLEKDGVEVLSSQGDPTVDPSLWFARGRQPEWVVVRAVRFPERGAARPANLAEIRAACRGRAARGHFASVAVQSADQPRVTDGRALPLVRGGGMYVSFPGLEAIEDEDGP